MPVAHDGAGAVVVTPEPPEVATGTVMQGCREFGAWDWEPVTAAGCEVPALVRAKYPAVTAVAAISAAAVQLDRRRTCRMPRSRLPALASCGDGASGLGGRRHDDGS